GDVKEFLGRPEGFVEGDDTGASWAIERRQVADHALGTGNDLQVGAGAQVILHVGELVAANGEGAGGEFGAPSQKARAIFGDGEDAAAEGADVKVVATRTDVAERELIDHAALAIHQENIIAARVKPKLRGT